MSDIEHCEDLVAQIATEYVGIDRFSTVTTTPDRILQTTKMGLWAQSLSEDMLLLDMTWLKSLAASGPGASEEYQGVRYRFAKRNF
ncbi:unnamed protein product [Penicillium glandicola]